MADKGWVKIHRQIEDNAIWSSNEPYDRRSAWVSLILMANHQDRETLINGKTVTIKRGQRFTSIRNLAEKWHWSCNRVRRYLDLLHSASMITINGTICGTLITIEKYGVFQDVRQADGYTDEYTVEYTSDSPANTRSAHKQELKNYKNGKNERNKSASRDISPEGVEYQ